MGRKTYDSTDALYQRDAISLSLVIASGTKLGWNGQFLATGCRLIARCRSFRHRWRQIYSQALEYADRLIVTEIQAEYQCDAFFPEIDPISGTSSRALSFK